MATEQEIAHDRRVRLLLTMRETSSSDLADMCRTRSRISPDDDTWALLIEVAYRLKALEALSASH